MNRVVVTGLAAITPIGNDLASSWEALLAGKSGIGPLTKFECTTYDTRIAGEVKGFDPSIYIPAKQTKRMETFVQFSVACCKMLLEDAAWQIPSEESEDTGVIIGVGLGGLYTIEEMHKRLLEKGPSRMSPFFIPIIIANMAAGQVSIEIGAKGLNACTTTACASGTHGIGYAYTEIRLGRCTSMICGGAESTLSPLGLAGFNALKALSVRNDEPERASRPFDYQRDGFVMGEGCGLLLLESLAHAKARDAKIYAEIVGFGASSDAHHMTSPLEDGSGMALAMHRALREAGVHPTEIDHINAHATSTILNDVCETRAIKTVFGTHASKISITGNKSMIGHLLGAAGGVESVFSVLAIHEGKIPRTLNLENPDPECDLDYVPEGTRIQPVSYTLCNSFGFGGTNACLLFKKFES